MTPDRSRQVYAAVFVLGLVLKQSFMTLHILGILLPATQILRALAVVVLVYALVVPLFRHRAVRVAGLVVTIVTTTAFLANLWYNRYFGNYLSLNEILSGEGYNPVSVLVRHIVCPSDLVFVLDVVLMAVLLYRGRRGGLAAGTPGSPESPPSPRHLPSGYESATGRLAIRGPSTWAISTRGRTRALLAAAVTVALIVQGYLANQHLGSMPPAELFAESTPAFASVYGVKPLYAMEALLRWRTAVDSGGGRAGGGDPSVGIAGESPELPDPSVQGSSAEGLSVKEEIQPPRASPIQLGGTTTVDQRSNVIVIQVESLDKKLIGHHHNGVEVTPFVNSLVRTSLYGRNFYAQHVNGSFDADFSLLTGLYPVNRGYSFRDNDMSLFPSLVKILAKEGYETLAFHGNDGDFFNRETAFRELGFDRFYSRRHFSREERRYQLDDSHLGINDYDFLYQSLDYLEEAEEPFFAYLITVTSHTPFTFHPAEHQVDAFQDIISPLVRDFFESIRFVDYALEMFFTELESRGLKDNTLVVIYSDHEAAIETPEYSSSINFEVNRNIKEPEHIPLIIRHPKLAPGILDQAGSITDLAPTILDILGFEDAPPHFAGASLLSDDDRPVLFIHELPQVLYRDQLFALELGELNRIGFIEGRAAEFPVPESIRELSLDLLHYSRQMMAERRRTN